MTYYVNVLWMFITCYVDKKIAYYVHIIQILNALLFLIQLQLDTFEGNNPHFPSILEQKF